MEYRQYEEMGREIRDALLQVREQVRNEAVAAAAPKTALTCPFCGATTTPDAAVNFAAALSMDRTNTQHKGA
jgi:hypothetical protein